MWYNCKSFSYRQKLQMNHAIMGKPIWQFSFRVKEHLLYAKCCARHCLILSHLFLTITIRRKHNCPLLSYEKTDTQRSESISAYLHTSVLGFQVIWLTDSELSWERNEYWKSGGQDVWMQKKKVIDGNKALRFKTKFSEKKKKQKKD